MHHQIAINAERLHKGIEALASMTRNDTVWKPRVTSSEFWQTREWLYNRFHAEGLSPRMDSAGNLVGRIAGTNPDYAPLVTGSQRCSVLGADRMDGIVGVLSGLESILSIRESGIKLQHDFEIIDFVSEEPFSIHGNILVAGGEPVSLSHHLIKTQPHTLTEKVRGMHGIAGFIGLGLDRCRMLEQKDLMLGIACGALGSSKVSVEIASTRTLTRFSPDELRRDVLRVSARLIKVATREAEILNGRPHQIDVSVEQVSLPAETHDQDELKAQVIMEVRSDSSDVLNRFPSWVLSMMEEYVLSMPVRLKATQLCKGLPTPASIRVAQAICQSAYHRKLPYRHLLADSEDASAVAGAGHIGMILIPKVEMGTKVSLKPRDRWNSSAGTQILAEALLEMDRHIDS